MSYLAKKRFKKTKGYWYDTSQKKGQDQIPLSLKVVAVDI